MCEDQLVSVFPVPVKRSISEKHSSTLVVWFLSLFDANLLKVCRVGGRKEMRIGSVSNQVHGVDKLLPEDDDTGSVTKQSCNKKVEEGATNWNRKMLAVALAT